MEVTIRIYKRYDSDLLAMADAGYPLSKMISKALRSYANSEPLHYLLDELIFFDFNDKKSIRLKVSIPNSDKNTCNMIKNIKHSYRNSFCKNVLRNALLQQNLVGYFADSSLSKLHKDNLALYDYDSLKNVIKCSEIKKDKKSISFLTKTVEYKNADTVKVEKPDKKPKKAEISSKPPDSGFENKKETIDEDALLTAFDAL